MSKGSIYTIKNVKTGKLYIGQTIGSISKRLSTHRSQLRRGVHVNTHLQNSFNKHGEVNFSFDLLLECDVSQLDEIEIRMIKDEKDKNNCYNVQNGGTLNKKMQESTKKKLSEILKSKHLNDSTYRKSYLKSRVKKIICLNNMKVYDGIYKASEELKISSDSICQVIYGKNSYVKSSDGILYQFDYYTDGKMYKYEPVVENFRTEKHKVICVNTKEIFNTVDEASNKFNIKNNVILRCCRKVRNYGGRMQNGEWLIWRFLDEYDENEKCVFSRKFGNHHRSKKIICTTTNEVFSSSSEACEKYGLASGNLSQVLNGKRNYCGKLNNGEKLTWKYA